MRKTGGELKSRQAAFRIFGSCGLLASAVLLGGCAFRTQATGMAVDYNDFVAQTTNRQTVLNILRAREREPMHFTSFAEVFGQIRGTGSASLGAAFNGDSGARTGTDTLVTNAGPNGVVTGTAETVTDTVTDNIGATNFTPSIGLQVTTGTDFKVAANTTDEFYKGILNPVSPATVIHYLRQGFPPDLMSHLLIGRLEFSAVITRPDGKEETVLLRTMQNNPDEPASAAEFAAAIRCRRLDYAMKRSEARTLPVLDLTSLAPIAPDLLKRVQAKVDASGKVTYELVTPAGTEFTLLLSEPDLPECLATRATLAADMEKWVDAQGVRARSARPDSATTGSARGLNPTAKALQGSARVTAGEELGTREGREQLGQLGEIAFSSERYFDDKLPEGWRGDLVIDLTLRSVQGILYYLGEYVRNGAPNPLLVGDCGYCLPIIRVVPLRELDRASRFVEVSYRGTRYGVPLSGAVLSREAGRSSQTIDLVQQLLNLNRTSKDLPTTPFVRVAN